MSSVGNQRLNATQDDSVSSSTSNEAAASEDVQTSPAEPKTAPDTDDHAAAVKDEPMEEEGEGEDVFEEEEEVKKVPKSKTWFLGGRMAKVEFHTI